MPKKKTKTPSSKRSESLFGKHQNLKWLLPLLFFVVLGLWFVHKVKEEIKENVYESRIQYLRSTPAPKLQR